MTGKEIRDIQPTTDWARVEQFLGGKLEQLRQSRVAVVGLGSLGSEIIRQLAMSGLDKFILVDPDRLDQTNVTRHVLGLSSLSVVKNQITGVTEVTGEHKAAGMKRQVVTERNPQADVWAVVGDAQYQEKLLAVADVAVLAGLGSQLVQSLIAEKMRQQGVVVVVAGLYQEAKAGEVFIIYPDQGPCYACFASYLNRSLGDETDLRAREFIYGLPVDAVQSVPALGRNVIRMASLVTEVVESVILQTSLHPDGEANLIIDANQRFNFGVNAEGQVVQIGPHQTRYFKIPLQPGCRICHQDAQANSGISLEQIQQQLKVVKQS